MSNAVAAADTLVGVEVHALTTLGHLERVAGADLDASPAAYAPLGLEDWSAEFRVHSDFGLLGSGAHAEVLERACQGEVGVESWMGQGDEGISLVDGLGHRDFLVFTVFQPDGRAGVVEAVGDDDRTAHRLRSVAVHSGGFEIVM